MWPIDRPPQWVDRSQELATLREGVEALRRGVGTAVWVEGEPGIGKSSLVALAIARGNATTGTVTFPSTVGWDGLEATEEGECHERKRIPGQGPRRSAGE
jgi:hypothetical protein